MLRTTTKAARTGSVATYRLYRNGKVNNRTSFTLSKHVVSYSIFTTLCLSASHSAADFERRRYTNSFAAHRRDTHVERRHACDAKRPFLRHISRSLPEPVYVYRNARLVSDFSVCRKLQITQRLEVRLTSRSLYIAYIYTYIYIAYSPHSDRYTAAEPTKTCMHECRETNKRSHT